MGKTFDSFLANQPEVHTDSNFVRRITLGKFLAVLSLPAVVAASLAYGNAQQANASRAPEAAPSYDCEFSGPTFDYTYGPADGVNTVVLKINGTGEGSGDPCFDVAAGVVESLDEQSYGTTLAQYGNTVRGVPASVVATQRQH